MWSAERVGMANSVQKNTTILLTKTRVNEKFEKYLEIFFQIHVNIAQLKFTY